MALISLENVSLGFGGPRLFDGINLQIEQGEWLGLLGRNGMGKSTLLKLVNGDINPQDGSVSRQQNLRTAYLPQEVPAGIVGKVFDIVADGLERLRASTMSITGRDSFKWSRSSRACNWMRMRASRLCLRG